MKKKNNFSLIYIIAILLIIGSLAITWLFLSSASKRELSSLESICFQIFILILSITGSFLLGNKISKASAFESIKPYSRSAFRRVMALYSGLSRLAEAAQDENNIKKDGKASLEKINAMIIEQLATAGDALEDWRDIVPAELEEIESNAKAKKKIIQKGISDNEK